MSLLIGPPSAENLVDALIVRRLGKMQPSLKILAGTHIISGTHVRSTEPAKQGIFCGPTPYSRNCNNRSNAASSHSDSIGARSITPAVIASDISLKARPF